MEYLYKNVSVFKNVKNSKTPIDKKYSLMSVLASDANRYKVELLRQLPKGSEDYRQIKESLPCFTPSGIFSTRSKSGLVSHSGIVCLDFDELEHPEEFRYFLKKYDFICFASLSCSGRGVFAFVQIECPELHSYYMDALQKFFDEEGAPIDPACKDVCRLRIASWDAKKWHADNARVWNTILPSKPLPDYKPREISGDVDQKLFLAGLDYIERCAVDVTQGRNNWLALAALVNNLFGVSGEAYFQALSRYHIKYNEAETRKVYSDCAGWRSNGIGVFANACTKAGMPDLRILMLDSQKGVSHA